MADPQLDLKENKLLEDQNNHNSDFVQQEEIKKILEETGIQNYDPQVVTHLADYINYYVTDILNHAFTFMEHAGRQTVDLADIKLALDVVSKKRPSKRLSPNELMKLAQEHNKTQLPNCNSGSSLPLPTEGCILTKCNYKLKTTNSEFPLNIPLMDITNRQNEILTLKNHIGGIPTVIRTSLGTMSVNVPMNLTPQRIILKPQTLTSNSAICTSHHKMEDSMKKRIKLEENKK